MLKIDWFHYTFAGPTPTPVAVEERPTKKHTALASVNNKVFMKSCVVYFDVPLHDIRCLEVKDLRGKTLLVSKVQEQSDRHRRNNMRHYNH